MANQRLRDALLRNAITTGDVAQKLGVDPKTVERWITKGRTPYPKHRHTVATMLRESESYLWPHALDPATSAAVAESEVLKVYPNRNAVSREAWDHLLDRATVRIDVLVYVGMFLTENPALLPALRAKGAAGARVRLLLGDPNSREVQRRTFYAPTRTPLSCSPTWSHCSGQPGGPTSTTSRRYRALSGSGGFMIV